MFIFFFFFQSDHFSNRFKNVEMFVHVFLDPYGYNEKKRRRENLMRMSALSSKREIIHSALQLQHTQTLRDSREQNVSVAHLCLY